MLRLGAVVLKVSDVDRAAAFWSAALGYEKQPSNPAFLVPDDAAPGTRLHLDDEDGTHLDLWADDEADQQAQVERLISLGAQRVDLKYPDDADFIVLAAPDGNLFCVIA
jgi:catechol 2,3-dioxygenase-like lactoylglutathione lyase family enzyme